MNKIAFVDAVRRSFSKWLNLPTIVRKKIVVGKNFVSYGKIKVIGGGAGRFIIGDNCIFRSGISTNPLKGSARLIFALAPGARIVIGNNVGISNSCLRITTDLMIEDNVNIGGDCGIYDSDMHSVDYRDRISIPDNKIKNAPIRIKEGAWIGAHCIILKGVTIGTRAVIGAGSVVTRNVPDNELWAGNPARFIKKINEKE